MAIDMFNKKKIAELEVLTKSLQDAVEKKSYFGAGEQAKFLTEFYKYMPKLSMIDFTATSFDEYIRYYKENAIVYGLVWTTIAKSVSELSDYIELVNDKKEVVTNHWANGVLERPNDLDNKRAFIATWAVLRLLTGNSFISLDKTAGSKRQIKEMYNIPANQIDIVTGGSLSPIKGYNLKTAGSTEPKFDTEEIIFSRDSNPDITSLYGVSPLQAAANFVQIIENSMKRQNTALINGGVSRVVTPKPSEYGLNAQDVDKLDKEMNEKHSGNYTKTLTIPIEVHELSDTPADLTILESSRYAINVLCFVYGISVDTFLAQAKYSNAKEAKKAIYEQAAIPLTNLFLADINKGFGRVDAGFKSGGLKFVLNTDKIEVLRGSVTEMLNAYNLANASINDKRELLGLTAIEEDYANQPIVPLGVTFGNPDIIINENNTTV